MYMNHYQAMLMTLLIADVPADETTYTDSPLTNGTMYYYVVTSVYDNGDIESVYSSVASATPMSTVVFTIGEDGVMSGSDVTLAIEMTNTEAVAGVQFDLVDNPDYMTIISVEGTERVQEIGL